MAKYAKVIPTRDANGNVLMILAIARAWMVQESEDQKVIDTLSTKVTTAKSYEEACEYIREYFILEDDLDPMTKKSHVCLNDQDLIDKIDQELHNDIAQLICDREINPVDGGITLFMLFLSAVMAMSNHEEPLIKSNYLNLVNFGMNFLSSHIGQSTPSSEVRH